MTLPVIIIGAGISGLSAAWRLYRKGVPFILLEAASGPGGLIGTVREDGFLTENGPNTFPAHAEELAGLCRDLGISPRSAETHAKKRYLYINGRLTALPINPLEAALSPVLSSAGKLRLLGEPFYPAGPAEEATIADFMSGRIGKEAVERLIDPMISGIYAGDIHQLSAPAVFPALWRWERTRGSLLKGVWGERKKGGASGRKRSAGTLMSFSEGMETLVQGLARALPPESMRFGESVINVQRTEERSQPFIVRTESGGSLAGQALILATPADAAARLVETFAPDLSAILADIPYNALAVTHLGFPREVIPHPLDGFGCLIPRREKIALLGSVWSSSLFENRAPVGHILLSNFLGGAHQSQVSEWEPECIRQAVLADLHTIFKTPMPLSPVYSRVLKYKRAIPQYNLGHLEKIQNLNALCEQYSDLSFCGNYLTGVSLNECVKSGFSAAERMMGTSASG